MGPFEHNWHEIRFTHCITFSAVGLLTYEHSDEVRVGIGAVAKRRVQ